MRDNFTLADREEMRSATVTKYGNGEITAVQARAEFIRQGWNATQIDEYMREAMRLAVNNTLAASRLRRAGNAGEGF